MIPKDPVVLLSFMNTKLRDYYESFERLCDDLDIDGEEVKATLASIDYHYNASKNQFTV